MVSVIIPTRNRLSILRKVIPTYIHQRDVSEIIIVDDQSNVAIQASIHDFTSNINKKIKVIRNSARCGAVKSKLRGVESATNEFILFGEDDAFIEEGYVARLLHEFAENPNAGCVAGHIIYLKQGEEWLEAKERFISEYYQQDSFHYELLKFNPFSFNTQKCLLPFAHALYLTNKSLLKKFKLDTIYSKGNGYREETDYQITLFLNNYQNILINDTFCYHYDIKDVPGGGQRGNIFRKYIWTSYYNFYFLNKHYIIYKSFVGLSPSLLKAQFSFQADLINVLFFQPILRRLKSIWK